jgi:hypothetical protein
VALPTVSFASPNEAKPVTPEVTNTRIVGVDERALDRAPAVDAEASKKEAPKVEVEQDDPAVLTEERRTEPFTVAGVTWLASSGVTAKDIAVHVRVRENGRWTDWEQLTVPDEGPDADTTENKQARVGTSPMFADHADGIQVRVDTPTGLPPAGLQVSTIDPGSSAADDNLVAKQPAASANAAARQPTIITRKDWGADERLRKPTEINSTVKAVVIHHTAGSNSYSAADAAAQVRGIYAYHTKTLGWSDIGYNFLVDRYGRVYEGRAGSITQAVQGAHAGGFNTDTMGVSAMGNFEVAQPPAVMVNSLATVTGWKLSQYNRDVLGKVTLTSAGGTSKYKAGTKVTLDVVTAHRNTGLTACPGQYLYAQLGGLRTKAANYAKYSSLTPPAPKPAPAPAPTNAYTPTDLFTADRLADLAAVDRAAGRLYVYPGNGKGYLQARTFASSGWKGMDMLTGVGDLNGDGRADLVARTPANGKLWLYPGNGKGGFGKALLIGNGGWNVMTSITGVGDFNGDGKADLIAVERGGKIWLYPGTGKGAHGKRVQIGNPSTIRHMMTGVGDLDGDRKPDVVTVDSKDGSLWVFSGNGKGGWSKFTKLGGGWGVMSDLAGVGDFNGDGKADLLAINRSTGKLMLYPGTGKGGFGRSIQVGSGWTNYDIAG